MTHKGYKQTAEHIAKRKRTGKDNWQWEGDAVSATGGRARALRKFPAKPCEKCGKKKAEQHHIDGDTSNNADDNVRFLCRRCHMIIDGRIEKVRQMTIDARPKMLAAQLAKFVNTKYRSGDKCPTCCCRLSIASSTKSGIVYIRCRKDSGGCGFNGGSYRRNSAGAKD